MAWLLEALGSGTAGEDAVAGISISLKGPREYERFIPSRSGEGEERSLSPPNNDLESSEAFERSSKSGTRIDGRGSDAFTTCVIRVQKGNWSALLPQCEGGRAHGPLS